MKKHARITLGLFRAAAGQRGQALIQTLVAAGVGMTLLMATMTILQNQRREVRALSETLAAKDVERVLQISLANGAVCQYVLNHPTALTFNSQALPQTITLPSTPANPAKLYMNILPGPPVQPGPIALQVGEFASPMSNSLVAASIQLLIESGSSGQYIGRWLIAFDRNRLVRSIRPISIATALTVNDTTPTAATVTSCSLTGSVAVNFSATVIAPPGTGQSQNLGTHTHCALSIFELYSTMLVIDRDAACIVAYNNEGTLGWKLYAITNTQNSYLGVRCRAVCVGGSPITTAITPSPYRTGGPTPPNIDSK